MEKFKSKLNIIEYGLEWISRVVDFPTYFISSRDALFFFSNRIQMNDVFDKKVVYKKSGATEAKKMRKFRATTLQL